MLKFLKKILNGSNKKGKVEVTASLVVNNTPNPSREMLKEATKLKKEKKYVEACEKLREAYAAKGSEELMVEERLRLPMYLQLAGKNDEGWKTLNEM